MPADGDWEPGFWDRIGIGPEWDRLSTDFRAAGAEVEDTEDIVLSFKKMSESKVRHLIEDARSGKYGDDVRTYWTAAAEEITR